jgi:pimeloyl-ACP methyl ester carboxylesterase
MTPYVLLPGAWSGGWQWRPVARLLRAAGHEVYTPTLTGLGERVHLASPAVDLETHVLDVLNVLADEELSGIVLVGFSYSGMVATAVAERAPARLAHLAYVDAFVPEDGQSLFDLAGPEVAARFEALARERGDGWRMPHDPPDAPRRTAHPLKTFQGRVAVGNPAAAALPRTYIYCTDKAEMGGGNAGIAASAARARAAGWRYRELPTSHVAMETMPRELTDLLLHLA